MKNKLKIIAITTITALTISIYAIYKSLQTEWVNVGYLISYLENENPEEIKNIPYRLYGARTKKGERIKETTDMIDLKLAAQSGNIFGKKVMLAVKSCWAPEVRQGLRTVACEDDLDDIFLSGDNETISTLLHLKKGQKASLVGVIVGSHADTPIIKIL